VSFDSIPFERATVLYPQPVALACGRVLSARTIQDRLDAIFKYAEVLTRYTCAAAIASFAARTDLAHPAPEAFERMRKNVSFGDFLTVVQAVAGVACDHPLKAHLASGFTGKNATANAGLIRLLELRNEHGHDLQSMSKPLAEAIFAEELPDQHLQTALKGLETVLRLPLFLFEEQVWNQQKLVGRRLLLMGESTNPVPDDVTLTNGVHNLNYLYLGLRSGVLPVYPFLVWHYSRRSAGFGVYFVHAIADGLVKYRSVSGDAFEDGGTLYGVAEQLLAAEPVPAEPVLLAGGENFQADWLAKRGVREQFWRQTLGEIPWDDFDRETLRWYASKLAPSGDPREVIRGELLDGRDRLSPDEIRELSLLFGTERTVRRLLRREMLDCRVQTDPAARWDERIEWPGNIFGALQHAIDCFARHVGFETNTLDALTATSGSADYVAIRESLINCFCHQDYGNAATVCQIELTPDRTRFYNPGNSMVPTDELIEGGKSSRRNPLIARALRRIRFAELGGSGIRELQRVWRQTGRRPPSFQSDARGNSFTLVLDWRPLPNTSDAFWRRRLDITVNPAEATVLTLATDAAGVTAEQVASAEGISVGDAKLLVEGLVRKQLVRVVGDRVTILDHLTDVAAEAAAIQWLQRVLAVRPRRREEIEPLVADHQEPLGAWPETFIDLDKLLEENFLRYDGNGAVPNQLHSYFTSERDDLEDCTPDDSTLWEAAAGYWYVADDRDTTDQRKLRERELLADYNTYRDPRVRKHEPPSIDALRAGFEKAWKERDYGTIVDVGSQVPEDLLQKDPVVLRWYDQAQQRMQEQG